MSKPADRKRLGYHNLDQIRTAEERAELIRQKVANLLNELKNIEPRLRQNFKVKLLEIDQAASDIYIAMDKISVEKPAEEVE